MRQLLASAFLAACLGALGACARTVVQNPQTTDYPPGDTTAELDFWHGLPQQSAVTNNQGLHGVLLLFDGADETQSYESRVATLQDRGWLPDSFDEAGDIALQRGTLAHILVRAMEVRGGVMMFVTSRHARYANIELQRIGVMPPGSEIMVIDGLDFVGTMSKAQDYMVVKGLREAEALDPAPPSENTPEAVQDTSAAEPS
jgi:hypothetical protein